MMVVFPASLVGVLFYCFAINHNVTNSHAFQPVVMNTRWFKDSPPALSTRWPARFASLDDNARKSSMRRSLSFTSNGSSSISLPKVSQVLDAVVCGGGPAGLLTAIMLADKLDVGCKIYVYDRLSPPPLPEDMEIWNDVAKFYLIGLGGRGQTALSQFGVWSNVVLPHCVAVRGRRDWSPESNSEEGTTRIFTTKDKPITTQVLPRDKLVGCLYQHIIRTPGLASRIVLKYGYEITPLDFDYRIDASPSESNVEEPLVKLRVSPIDATTTSRTRPTTGIDAANAASSEGSEEIVTKLLVAADGTIRTVANAMETADRERICKIRNPIRRFMTRVMNPPFRVIRYIDDNQRIYKTIPMKIPSDWRPDLNYSARTKGGRINFDALPANSNGEFCGVLLLKKDDSLAAANTDPVELRQRLNESLPQFSRLLDDETIVAVAQKPVSFLPGFRYVTPRLRQGDRTLILGDCAHTVKPYFGLGANSALQDVKIFGDILESQQNGSDGSHLDFTAAVHEFSKRQAGEAQALVTISRDLDRPGKLGFVTFILPLILDSIFHGLAPKLFAPNIITMLQREDYTFQRVARRKRIDRLAQVSIIGGTIAGLYMAALFSIRAIAKAVNRNASTIILAGGVGAASVTLLRKLSQYLIPGLAPADVLNRLLDKRIVNSRDHITPLGRLYRGNTANNAEPENETNDIPEIANGESFLTPLGFQNRKQ
jgi:kynurenine 3-monooxygenase